MASTTTEPATETIADKPADAGAAPVLDDGRVVGIFSERDVIHCLQAKGAGALTQRIGDVMTRAVKSVAPTESVIGALSLMTQRRIRHLPVID